VAASVEAAASSAGVIFDDEAGGGVSLMACIIVTILRFVDLATFFAAEGSSFFYKSFISCGPVDLAA
jgi:hypothetical protein